MAKDEIVASAFAALDRALRPASMAQVGGFRPNNLPAVSWFGGWFYGAPGETWPTADGAAMIPLLQIRTSELQVRPRALDGIELLNVFVHPDKLPTPTPAKSGDGWLIRTYSSVDGLLPLKGQPQSGVLRFQVMWLPPRNDAPTWEDAWNIADLKAFNELPDAGNLFDERYQSIAGTKVGGWPSSIQGSAGMTDDFVFQIGSEPKCKWSWGDNGIGYFYFRDGAWLMHWDCY
jgi:hypothetical protein